MLEGPNSQETDEDKECVITPSTSVKFNAALRERNHINFMKNYLLLIGITLVNESECKIRYKRSSYLLPVTVRIGVSGSVHKFIINSEVLILCNVTYVEKFHSLLFTSICSLGQNRECFVVV